MKNNALPRLTGKSLNGRKEFSKHLNNRTETKRESTILISASCKVKREEVTTMAVNEQIMASV